MSPAWPKPRNEPDRAQSRPDDGKGRRLAATWSEVRARVLALKGSLPADGVVVIGETWSERDWCEAARLAGYPPAAPYFGGPE
jgi:hypothetical protein